MSLWTSSSSCRMRRGSGGTQCRSDIRAAFSACLKVTAERAGSDRPSQRFVHLLSDGTLCSLDDVLRRETKVRKHFRSRRRTAEVVQTNDRSIAADILPPALGGASFNCNLWHTVREDAELVRFILLVEEVETGHG